MSHMKRRAFIGIAAAGAAGATWTALAGSRDSDPLAILASPQVIAVLHDHRLVHELGQRYREMTPDEQSTSALADAILADVDQSISSASLATRVNDRVQRDFAAGRTVTLNGWVLALTEARQCALYSLLSL